MSGGHPPPTGPAGGGRWRRARPGRAQLGAPAGAGQPLRPRPVGMRERTVGAAQASALGLRSAQEAPIRIPEIGLTPNAALELQAADFGPRPALSDEWLDG